MRELIIDSPSAESKFIAMPSGLILPRRAAESELRRHRRPRAMDFFAGAGGMSLGMIQGGMEVVAAAEWDCTAAVTYMANLCRYGAFTIHFVTEDDRKRLERYLSKEYARAGMQVDGGAIVADGALQRKPVPLAGQGYISHQGADFPGVSHIFFGDIRKLSSATILAALGMQPGELDCIAGGPPCQGFSKAGKQDIYDERNSMIWDFARFIVEMKPKTMVMENVPEIAKLVTPEGVPVLDKLCRILSDGGFGGYDAFQRCVDQQAGRIGLIRAHQAPKSKSAAAPTADQFDMFGGEVPEVAA